MRIAKWKEPLTTSCCKYRMTCFRVLLKVGLQGGSLCVARRSSHKVSAHKQAVVTEELPVYHQSLSQGVDNLRLLPESACIVVWQVFRQNPASSIPHNGLECVLTGICGQPAPNATFKVWRHIRRPPQSAGPHLLLFLQQRASDECLYARSILLRHYFCPRGVQASYGTGSFCRMPIQYHAFFVELSKGFPKIETLL